MTRSFTKIGLSVLLAVLLLLPVMAGCAKPSEPVPPEEEILIKVGNIVDFTSAVSCCGILSDKALRDYFQYLEDENEIPGVKFEVISFDCALDPGKTSPGYQFCKGQGMDIMVTCYGQDGVIVKPLAAADRIPHLTYNSNQDIIDPPAWTFCQVPLVEDVTASFWAWLIDNWDYEKMGRSPKVAHASWPTATGLAAGKATEVYCQSRSDKIDLVSMKDLPMGTVDMTEPAAEWDRLGVDWVFNSAPTPAMLGLVKEKQAKGYGFEIAAADWVFACSQIYLQIAGPAIVGTHWLTAVGWQPPLSLEITARYNSAEDIKKLGYDTGICYWLGQAFGMQIEDAVKKTIKAGKDPRNGDAIYEQLVKVKNMDTAGIFPPLSYNETRRLGTKQMRIYEMSAPDGMPKLVEDWFDVVSFDGSTAKYYE